MKRTKTGAKRPKGLVNRRSRKGDEEFRKIENKTKGKPNYSVCVCVYICAMFVNSFANSDKKRSNKDNKEHKRIEKNDGKKSERERERERERQYMFANTGQ